MPKGIVLAGGTGTRLRPLTLGVNKHLLPVYNKPMIYYSLGTLMLAKIREILIVTNREDLDSFKRVLGDGTQLGMHLNYAVQSKPDGIAGALIMAEEFLEGEPATIILGDNVFHFQGLSNLVQKASESNTPQVFCHHVEDPSRYGVLELGPNGEIISIEEKPINPKSHLAVTGLYCLGREAISIAKSLTPSSRGELEIVDILNSYAEVGTLGVNHIPRGGLWFDAGTFESINSVSALIRTVEETQGEAVASIEEISWRNGWIPTSQLYTLADALAPSAYGAYLKQLARGEE